jgi:hypothetical protein
MEIEGWWSSQTMLVYIWLEEVLLKNIFWNGPNKFGSKQSYNLYKVTRMLEFCELESYNKELEW